VIALFTDFGCEGPYTGQVEAVLHQHSPGTPVVRLLADAPGFNARASAYLLAACTSVFPPDTVFLCVIDPGVGSDRRPLIMSADGCWFVGPDNGLLEITRRQARQAEVREVLWRPARLSASFHGRDLFAPVAAMLANGDMPHSRLPAADTRFADWPDDLAEIIYIDHYGNAVTGTRACMLGERVMIEVAGCRLRRARTFNDVEQGAGFWYENANGLVEIAVNCGNAAAMFDLAVGTRIGISQATRA